MNAFRVLADRTKLEILYIENIKRMITWRKYTLSHITAMSLMEITYWRGHMSKTIQARATFYVGTEFVGHCRQIRAARYGL